MMKKIKQVFGLLLAFAMIFSVFPASALAVENRSAEPVETVYATYINPFYADELTEADLVQSGAVMMDDVEYCTSIQAAGEAAREQLKARSETVTVGLMTDTTDKQQMYDVMDAAMEHTGIPTEGDYLKWQYGGWSASMGGYSSANQYYLTLTYTMTYYTTAEQEAEMDAAVKSLLAELDAGGASDYESVCAVYDWVCENVTYDYANLDDSAYKLKYTAYAALLNGTAVCQGYAVLFYRLALELGVDARVITGIGNGGAHAWNIVELDNEYYNLDSTWDAGRSSYSYFLKCDANFSDHTRDDDYSTEEFYAAYPMGTEDYVPVSEPEVITSGTCGDDLTWELSDDGVLTVTGTGDMVGTGALADVWEWDPVKDRITTVSISDGVTSIGDNAFNNCSILSEVMISESVARIGSNAFSGCSSLTSITFDGDAPEIDEGAFTNVSATAYYPAGNTTWNSDTMQNYGGTLTWVAYGDSAQLVITAQPSDLTVTEGEQVRFSVGVTGDGLTYQWYLKYVGEDWRIWSGRTTATTAPFTCTTKHNGLQVYCVITDANGNSVTSDIATLTVDSNPFTDIDTDSVYYTAVMWAYKSGITSGTTATTFSPNAVCTRAQVVVFLWRYMGEPEPEDQENPFTDVDPSSSSYKAIMWAYQNGITTGINATTFGPSNKVSRAQFVLFLWRAMGKPEPETTVNPFVDVSDTSSYYKAVLWAYENGITTGVDATHFDPDTSCTRAQVVAFLYRGLAE